VRGLDGNSPSGTGTAAGTPDSYAPCIARRTPHATLFHLPTCTKQDTPRHTDTPKPKDRVKIGHTQM
jgi:hypothetical protein